MLVGVNEAARRLGVGPSTVSRQLARFTAHGMMDRAPSGEFDFETFKQLRAGALNPLMARNVAPPPPTPSAPEPAPAPARSDDLRQAHTAEKIASAAIKRIELLERADKVCDKASVAAAGADAARALTGLLDNRRRALAEELAALVSADEIEARLADADRALLAQLRDEAARAASEPPRVELADVA